MILVTGATGFLGQYITNDLLKQVDKVRIAVRDVEKAKQLFPNQSKIEIVELDLLDQLGLEKALENITHVIHAAGFVSYNKAEKELMYKYNVDVTRMLVNLCLEKNITKFLFVSSIAAIGREKKSKIINEDTKWVDSDYNTTYAVTKYQAELEVWRGVEEGLNAVIVNPSVILGFGDWMKSSPKIYRQAYRFGKYYPEGTVNWIDVRDVSGICIRLLFSDCASQRYILNTGNITYKALLEGIAKRFKRPEPATKIPHFLIRFWANIEFVRNFLFKSDPMMTKETALLFKHTYNYSNEKVINELSYNFRCIDNTLDWSCPLYVDKYDL